MNGVRTELPPVSPCPPWCSLGFHAWEPDGDEYTRTHISGNLASSQAGYTLKHFQCDHFAGGLLEHCKPCVVLDDVVLAKDEAARLMTDLAGALR